MARAKVNVIVVTVLLVVVAVYTILPLYWLVVASGKSLHELFATSTFVPGPAIQYGANLKHTFTWYNADFGRWLGNSFLYAGVGSVVSVYFAAMAGYLLGWFRFRGQRVLLAGVVAGLAVPGTVLVIPIYIVETRLLHIVNSYQGVILPLLVYPLGVFFMYVYSRQTIPAALLDAGRVDGAGELRLFHTVGLRLLVPGFVTLTLLSFVGIWNNYFLPLILLSKPELYPTTLGLGLWVSQLGVGGVGFGGAPPYLDILMGALVSIVPLLVVFPFLQRYVRSGILAGAFGGE